MGKQVCKRNKNSQNKLKVNIFYGFGWQITGAPIDCGPRFLSFRDLRHEFSETALEVYFRRPAPAIESLARR